MPERNSGKKGKIMGTVTIGNLDDRAIAALKAQAEADRQSLEDYLRFVLTRQAGTELKPAVPNRSASASQGTAPLFHTHIVVDWSAKAEPGPKKPTKDGIWWAVARIEDGVRMEEPRYARTRHAALEGLAGLISCEMDQGRRVLAGFDFPFGYPAGVAEHLTGKTCALTLWDWLAERIKDAPDNKNNRFCVAAAINDEYSGVIGPCWGHPPGWNCPGIPSKETQRTCREPDPKERRITDRCAKGAKTVWQLWGAGAVGSQVLMGLPALKRLKSAPGIAGRAKVWPLETGLRTPQAQAVFAEVYPSLLKDNINAQRGKDEILDCAQVRVTAGHLAVLDAEGRLASCFAGPSFLTPEERRIVETEEAWILGLGVDATSLGASSSA